MILKSLNLADQDLKPRETMVVPVPQFGEDAEVMITKITIKGYIRRSNLHTRITKMKDLTECKEGEHGIDHDTRTSYMLCAQLLSVMVHPETSDFLLPENELEKFASIVSEQTLEALLVADAQLNPKKEIVSMEQKKS